VKGITALLPNHDGRLKAATAGTHTLFLRIISSELPVLAGWGPEQCQTSFAEPLQQAFVEKDCPAGVMKKLY